MAGISGGPGSWGRAKVLVTAVAALALVMAADGRLAAQEAPRSAIPNFDKVGPQVGDQLPTLNLRTAKGEPQRLSDAWRGGPALSMEALIQLLKKHGAVSGAAAK